MTKYKVGYSWERKGIEYTIVSSVRNESDSDYIECLVKECRPNESNDGMDTFYVHHSFLDAPLYDVIMFELSSSKPVPVYKFNVQPLTRLNAEIMLKKALRTDLYDNYMEIRMVENKEGI